ncbi:TonB-dependent receptor plug domain-containing protein [Pedobacter sp.]|uniref:TonB-dependent receptor plug domain-containing protein n=1 Tax=Pedobacter sp. TaxID=1411316 RepID=UPI003BABF0A1
MLTVRLTMKMCAALPQLAGAALVLVDGMPSSLNLINPVGLESVTVLKNAASAAIYGARGAFGVILVTTKKGGKDQKEKITYSGGLRFNRPTFLPDVLNTKQHSWPILQA